MAAQSSSGSVRSVTGKKLGIGLSILASAALVLTACGSSSPSNNSQSAASGSPTSSASGGSGGGGTPNLKGQTIRVVEGSAPQTSDTTSYIMVQILKSWGANATVVNQADAPSAARALLAGDADVGAYDQVQSAVNSGTVLFGPSAPRLDYDFVGAPSLTSISQLPGHLYGTSNTHGVEAIMFADLLQKYNINPSKVRVVVAGGSSVRVAAMLAHRLDATFVHTEDTPQLIKAGFHILASMPSIASNLADSFLSSTPQWLKAHPSLAVAVDEAWIKAAQVFNNDESQWEQAAVAYAGAGTTQADAKTAYNDLKAINSYPVAKSDFTAASAQSQEQLSAKVGALNGAPPPLSKFFTSTYWDQATSALGIQ